MHRPKPTSLSARGHAVARLAGAAIVLAAGGVGMGPGDGEAAAQVADAPTGAPTILIQPKPVIELQPAGKPTARPSTGAGAGPGMITLPPASARPTPRPSPKPLSRPAPGPAPSTRPPPRPTAAAEPPPAAKASPTPSATPTLAASAKPVVAPAPVPTAAVPPTPAVAPTAAGPATIPQPEWTDIVLMGLGGLASLGWMYAWLRRRRPRTGADAVEPVARAPETGAPEAGVSAATAPPVAVALPPETVPEPEPAPVPPLPVRRSPQGSPPPPSPAPPAPAVPFTPSAVPGQRQASAAATAPLLIEAMPERLTISLVMATLRYRLRIANRGETALGEVVVRGGMIAAHASLPEEEQLGGEGSALVECHHFIGLAPGEAVELTGELRVQLADLAPIRVGNAALFVPLVRFRASAVAVSGAVVEDACVLAVGEPPATPGAGIRPFRLDLGPRLYNEISSRRLLAPN